MAVIVETMTVGVGDKSAELTVLINNLMTTYGIPNFATLKAVYDLQGVILHAIQTGDNLSLRAILNA